MCLSNLSELKIYTWNKTYYSYWITVSGCCNHFVFAIYAKKLLPSETFLVICAIELTI